MKSLHLWFGALAPFIISCSMHSAVRAPSSDETLRYVDHEFEAYRKLYPDFVEACAMTQIRPKDEVQGGKGGHATLYIANACVDEVQSRTMGVTQIKVCDGTESPATPGLVVSVDQVLEHQNWVAIPSRSLFLWGVAAPTEPVSAANKEGTIQYAINHKIFENLVVHDKYKREWSQPGWGSSVEEFVAREGLGTNYAVNYAREVYCVRLPLKPAMTSAIVAELNAHNREFLENGTTYVWNGMGNNCAHTVYNALAAAQIWQGRKLDQFGLDALLNLAIPGNVVVDLTSLANKKDQDLSDVAAFYIDQNRQALFKKYHWIPFHDGAVSVFYPQMKQSTDALYLPTQPFFMYDPWIVEPNKQLIARLRTDTELTDLGTNRQAFLKRYQAALDNMRSLKSLGVSWRPSLRSADFMDFYDNYRDFLKERIHDLDPSK